ncbi:NlpC/P60 family protein [Liquorilactobacillus satsumensis]|uniref:NlpC P60 n=1 Tax=Liquorilactobacillus satsumensis DSM 16230 = JCM 12392 TaxID=1423801 RepID=A0A0R1V532_9LACO|nr:C40 family peptidase [Liquorilactobacillus satsumensis]KRM00261.1 NlpC P60 [Liquorilactobacillus satsumensis DSM 16230 = JCM 12392]
MKKGVFSKVVVAAVAFSAVWGLSVRALASDTEQKLNEVNQKITQKQDLVDGGQKKLSKLQDQQFSDETEIKELTKNINARKAHLSDQARSAQVNDTGSLIEFVTDSKSVSDAVGRIATVATMVNANNQTLNDQKRDKLKVAADKQRIAEAVTQQQKLNEQLRNDMADLAVQKVELKVQKAKEDADKKKAEDALAATKQAAAAAKQAKDNATAAQALANVNKAAATVTTNKTTSTADSSSSTTATTTNTTSTNTNSNVQTVAVKSTSTSSTTQSSMDTSSVVSAALSLTKMGIPYVWGGSSLSGMDCSGLTAYVYSQFGVSLPHNTVSQEGYVTYESVSQAEPGDLLFWGSKGSSYHVAIYIGGGQFVHAPTEGENVKVGSISSFAPSFAGRLK